LVVTIVVVIALVVTSGKSTHSSSDNPGSIGDPSSIAAAPPTFLQVVSALESTGITLCDDIGNGQTSHQYEVSGSGNCSGATPDIIVWIYTENSASDVVANIDPKEVFVSGRTDTTAWIDGTIGVVDTNPAPGTANALEGLGMTALHLRIGVAPSRPCPYEYRPHDRISCRYE
jgi:hypothetical protein